MEKTIKIKDLGLASYISANSIKPLKVKKIEGTVYFYYPEKETGPLISSYWNDTKPLVPARQLFSSQRSLKDLIFQIAEG